MAEYKIIVGSSCELPEQYKGDNRFDLIPFRLEINGVPLKDTEDVNTKTLLERIAESKALTNAACPAPDVFYNSIATGNQKRVYIITITSKLSRCYLSAMVAKKLYEENHSDKEIYVIESNSFSGGESQLALLTLELEEQGVTGEELKKKVLSYREQMNTFVVLNNIGNMCQKIPQIKEMINLNQMVENVSAALKGASEQTRVIITHCNNLIDAEALKNLLMEKTGLKNIVIMKESAVNSIITHDGGIVVSF